MQSKRINSDTAAELLGVRRGAYLLRWCGYIESFPQPTKTPARVYEFDRAAVLAWSRQHDLKSEIRTARRHLQRDTREKSFPMQARAFLTGAYLPPTLREQLEFKKLAARVRQASTVRVRVASTWYDEEIEA